MARLTKEQKLQLKTLKWFHDYLYKHTEFLKAGDWLSNVSVNSSLFIMEKAIKQKVNPLKKPIYCQTCKKLCKEKLDFMRRCEKCKANQ